MLEYSLDHLPSIRAESCGESHLCSDENSFEGDSSTEEPDDDESISDEEEKPDVAYLVMSLLRSDIQPVLDATKQQIVNQILDNLEWVLPTTPSSVRSCAGTDNSHGTQRSGRAETQTQTVPTGRSARQGSTNGKGIPPGGDEGEEDKLHLVPATSLSGATLPKFACPFFQKDPQKYQNVRSCPGPGWHTVHRVK